MQLLKNTWFRISVAWFSAHTLLTTPSRLTLVLLAWRAFQERGISGVRQGIVNFYARGRSYQSWINRTQLVDADRQAIGKHISVMVDRPTISVVMPVFNPDIVHLKEAILSVQRQLYSYWELCIADDASANPEIINFLSQKIVEDGRIHCIFRPQNGGISAASNSALSIAKGDLIAFLDHDNLLTEHALYSLAHSHQTNPDAVVFYSDEDKVTERGMRQGPYFKPDWDPYLLQGQNYLGHLTAYRRTHLEKIGGFRGEFDGAQDWDLALRATEGLADHQVVHISDILYHWRETPQSTAKSIDAKPYAIEAGRRAVTEHLARLETKAYVTDNGFVRGHFHVERELPNPVPKVSILIPTKNGLKLIERCINTLTTLTSYPSFELIVIDNGSNDPSTLTYLQSIEVRGVAIVLRRPGPFNFSALNNDAARYANGDVLCLLNNDTEIIHANWLNELVSLTIQPQTGAVGAMLYYPNGTIQHAGVVIGLGEPAPAGHIYCFASGEELGDHGRARITQTLSAVTGACLVVRKSVYLEVGGFDEVNLAIAYNDIDFCLRLKEHGYRNLWTPFAELKHHESASRGYDTTPEKRARYNSEIDYMKSRWAHYLECDPAFNMNLDLRGVWPTPAKVPRTVRPWTSYSTPVAQRH